MIEDPRKQSEEYLEQHKLPQLLEVCRCEAEKRSFDTMHDSSCCPAVLDGSADVPEARQSQGVPCTSARKGAQGIAVEPVSARLRGHAAATNAWERWGSCLRCVAKHGWMHLGGMTLRPTCSVITLSGQDDRDATASDCR